ncbi:MAG: protein kinase [Pseudomonadales bacterium]|nr:protein kinase [Pseudomonadales bacterium]
MSDIEAYPETMDRYKVIRMIGVGASAEVLEVYDPKIDRRVAMKVLKSDVDEEYQKRFLSEAKAAGALSHPNIATIYDVGQTANRSYITIELLETATLADKMSSSEHMSRKQILAIAIDLAKALAYAHREGVIHRDIKPENIMFSSAGVAKISDFGIARRDNADDINMTQAGTVMGTPRYMSPEQAMAGDIDGRTDLYALGVILYELLSGERVVNASTMTSLLLQITQEEPVPIKKLVSDLPAGLSKIVSKLLRKQPAKRFQTGEQLVDALETELGVIIDQEHDRERNKYVPLKVKWAAAMGGMVAFVLLISMVSVYRIQVDEITSTVTDSGGALAKFIATQAAIPVLSEDWISLESFVHEAGARNTFEYLKVTDHTGVVRASTNPAEIGQIYVPVASTLLPGLEDGDVSVSEIDLGDSSGIFNFDTPVLFQNTEVGRINMGLSRKGLDSLMATTVKLMLVIALVTLASVVLVMYVVTGLLAKPIALLRRSMERLGEGESDLRISDERMDEIGELYTAFNGMADNLQDLVQEPSVLGEVGFVDTAAEKVISVEIPGSDEQLGSADRATLQTVIAVKKTGH